MIRMAVLATLLVFSANAWPGTYSVTIKYDNTNSIDRWSIVNPFQTLGTLPPTYIDADKKSGQLLTKLRTAIPGTQWACDIDTDPDFATGAEGKTYIDLYKLKNCVLVP